MRNPGEKNAWTIHIFSIISSGAAAGDNEREEAGVDIVLAFIEKINAHDVHGLMDLMTEDHEFIDSLGRAVNGREAMRKGWEAYFRFCPDYAIASTTFSNRATR